MLEIGIDESHSLDTWLEYFPKAFIYGIDIRLEVDGERHRIFQADQSDRAQVRKICTVCTVCAAVDCCELLES